LKAGHPILVTSADTICVFNTGFDTAPPYLGGGADTGVGAVGVVHAGRAQHDEPSWARGRKRGGRDRDRHGGSGGISGGSGDFLVAAAQAGSESKMCKQSIILQFQALSSRRFQLGFDRVNLHRPTLSSAASGGGGRGGGGGGGGAGSMVLAAANTSSAASRCCGA